MGVWQAVVMAAKRNLRCPVAGTTEMRMELRHLGNPTVRMLRSSQSDPEGALPFLLHARPGWCPRVLAAEKRDEALKLLIDTAASNLDITATGDTSACPVVLAHPPSSVFPNIPI